MPIKLEKSKAHPKEDEVLILAEGVNKALTGVNFDVAFSVIMTLLNHAVDNSPEDIRADVVLAIMETTQEMIKRHDLKSNIIMPGTH